MLERETIIGKLIELPEDTTFESLVNENVSESNIKRSINDYKESFEDIFNDELYRDYVFHNGKFYKVTETKHFDYADIFEATKNEKGEIEFVLNYYNGGCSFNEAIEQAIDNMNKGE